MLIMLIHHVLTARVNVTFSFYGVLFNWIRSVVKTMDERNDGVSCGAGGLYTAPHSNSVKPL